MRLFGLGTSPSMINSFDSLYEDARYEGSHIDGNKLAFQNIVTEEKNSCSTRFSGGLN